VANETSLRRTRRYQPELRSRATRAISHLRVLRGTARGPSKTNRSDVIIAGFQPEEVVVFVSKSASLVDGESLLCHRVSGPAGAIRRREHECLVCQVADVWNRDPADAVADRRPADSQAPITISGEVSKVEWTNPHTYVYVDTKDTIGKVVTWSFEGYPPNTLKRTGVPRDLLKVGDVITITGWKARFTANRAAGREVTLPDGKKVFLGPAASY